ncbi:MAG TPA: C4-dicarboxylate ABC transporter substrate-binding protein, partial [bacterium]|nr:C4-dicarboxylate ABC transporter substrate-binding protein [bacterium]
MAKQPLNHRDIIKPLVPRKTLALVIVLLVLFLAGIFCLCTALHPLPPRRITMATGPDGSNYAFWGKRYKILLAKEGIELDLVATKGGVENLKLLRDPNSGVQLGFVEGGVASDSDSPDLVSLGTLGYEPVWFFSRKVASDRGLFAFRGKRVSIGPEGSDSRALMDELLKRNALDTGAFHELNLEPEAAAAELLNG